MLHDSLSKRFGKYVPGGLVGWLEKYQDSDTINWLDKYN